MTDKSRQDGNLPKALGAGRKTELGGVILAVFGTQDPGGIHRAIDTAAVKGSAIAKLRGLLAIDRAELAAAFAMTERTLIRLETSSKPLSVEDADRVYRVSRIADLAAKMIGNPEEASRWLRTVVPALGGLDRST